MKLNLASVLGICIGWAVCQAAFADGTDPCGIVPGGPILFSGDGVVVCSDPCTGGSATAGGSSTGTDHTVTYPGSDLVFSVVDNGDGSYGFSFSNPSNLDLSYITSVTIDDVDGDGFPDLILGVNSSASGGAGVQVLINDGTGSGIVVHQTTLATGAAPASVVTADVDGDGWDDIVTANGSADSASVYINDGDGSFAPAISYPTGSYAGNLMSQDLNEDGMPDLLLNSNGSLTLLVNNGDGSFAHAKTYAGGDFSTVITGDLVGDGEADLILYGGTSGIGVMLAHGDGSYAPILWTKVAADSIDVDDFNNDGVPDLSVASLSAGTVTVLLGHGDGSFGAPASYSVGAGPVDIWSFDEDGDGWEDIVTDNDDGTQSLFLNHGDGSFAPAQAYTPPPIDVCFFMAGGALAKGTGALVEFKDGDMIMKGLKHEHRLGQRVPTSAGAAGGGDMDLLCLVLLAGLTALRRRR